MELRLCWRPSLQGVQVQEALCEIDKGRAVSHLCNISSLVLSPSSQDKERSLAQLHTSLNLTSLHPLPRHRVPPNNLRQRRRREVLLPTLLLDPLLPRILLDSLQPPIPPPILINALLKELPRLLAHLQHPAWWETLHLSDARNLIVLA